LRPQTRISFRTREALPAAPRRSSRAARRPHVQWLCDFVRDPFQTRCGRGVTLPTCRGKRNPPMRNRPFLSMLLSMLCVVGLAHAATERPLQVQSPGGSASATLTVDDGGQPHLAVAWRGEQVLLPSPLGMQFGMDDRLDRGLRVTGSRRGAHDSTYRLVAGKAREVRDHYTQL